MEVREGQVVGVIGSNSAGKTTLMNTLSGLIIDMRIKEKRRGGERITVYGKILYRGEDITETRDRALPRAASHLSGKRRTAESPNGGVLAEKG